MEEKTPTNILGVFAGRKHRWQHRLLPDLKWFSFLTKKTLEANKPHVDIMEFEEEAFEPQKEGERTAKPECDVIRRHSWQTILPDRHFQVTVLKKSGSIFSYILEAIITSLIIIMSFIIHH